MDAKRIDIGKINPSAYKPIFELYNTLKTSTLTPSEFSLVQIRASQINGCAYCIQLHIKDAIESGEKQYRIHALSTWKESPFFTKEEQLILEMTEDVTNISVHGLRDELYKNAIEHFGKQKVADIIMGICCINVWNRIGRSTLLTPIPSQD